MVEEHEKLENLDKQRSEAPTDAISGVPDSGTPQTAGAEAANDAVGDTIEKSKPDNADDVHKGACLKTTPVKTDKPSKGKKGSRGAFKSQLYGLYAKDLPRTGHTGARSVELPSVVWSH